MKLFKYPARETWSEMLERPPLDLEGLTSTVKTVLENVRSGGDAAVRRYTSEFDQCELDSIAVTEEEIVSAVERVSDELKAAIAIAVCNIEKFHATQTEQVKVVETTEGVSCWRRSVPIEKVGLYVPGGTAPLFSTVLMLAIPAKLAACREIVMCSPPDRGGRIADVTLYAASVCGVTKVFRVGGAQAIAAMAYGTESVPKVDKIFGPGNQYVTCAKQLVFQTGTAIDMPAGPSEVAILADETSIPAFVAADLLSQAEHGADSQVILISTSEKAIERTFEELEKQIGRLPRKEIASAALSHSKAILVENIDTGIEIVNAYAPEHLILAVENADEVAERVTTAGSVFIGNYSCESAGDYASGTNHTLPTGGFARSYGGVSLDSFVKKITFQKLSSRGLQNLGPAIETMAAAEGLDAHRRAVSIRLEEINRV
jgi:histidinol dehydrogenase